MLDLPNTELQTWKLKTLALVAKGVSRLRDYSSGKFLTRLMEIYIGKRDDNENTYGMMILMAVYFLPLESNQIIQTEMVCNIQTKSWPEFLFIYNAQHTNGIIKQLLLLRINNKYYYKKYNKKYPYKIVAISTQATFLS
ncbi:MAG: hypothetical protein QS721_11295 [Candidatus Endonucleobacter sp. (ex Gigantidas childressi)]|nr:hypothetical protein [Candidatus Endonucleobacter sp. (ex Gigantidas childressi)]